jgi:hypothetical protein
MSGWQRIGLLLSIAWVLFLPFWLVHDTNSRAEEDMEFCIKYAVMNNTGDRENERIHQCGDAYSKRLTTLPRLMTNYLTPGPDRPFLWLFTLGPIALLWAFGGGLLSIVRWIRRGFVQAAN